MIAALFEKIFSIKHTFLLFIYIFFDKGNLYLLVFMCIYVHLSSKQVKKEADKENGESEGELEQHL